MTVLPLTGRECEFGVLNDPVDGVGDRGARRCRGVHDHDLYVPTRAPTPKSDSLLRLRSDGERVRGAYALHPEAGERLQQATPGDPRQRSTRCAARHHFAPAAFSEIGQENGCAARLSW
jgi:hypothetical protein